MTQKDIIQHRLINQQIAETNFTKPEEIVAWLGAVQSQDWAMAKWALGLRLPGTTEKEIEKAFNDGKVLRTHVLRPTWHFVAPADIRWLLQLSAPRVHALNALYYRKFELDKKVLTKCNQILVKSLRYHTYKTREELNDAFGKAKIPADRLRLAYIMMNAELEGLICSGPRKGKQFTYALLEERVKAAKPMTRVDALNELTSRYFTSRGPATIKDYVWWSGLTVKDAKEGISMLDKNFSQEEFEGQEYIFIPQQLKDLKKLQTTFLVPDYDEYGISYKDRSVYNNLTMKGDEKLKHPGFYHAIAVDGFHGGNWKRTMKGNQPVVEIETYKSLSRTQLSSVEKALKKYRDFFT